MKLERKVYYRSPVQARVNWSIMSYTSTMTRTKGGQMVLKEIYIGSTDAKNEVLANSPDEISRFMRLYVTPPALSIDSFADRKKYFISGLKGTGKTALLRFVALRLDETQAAVSRFVLFKSEVDEDMRNDFASAARIQLVHENSTGTDESDFEL